MCGPEDRSSGLFSYIRLDDRIAADHPLRAIRALVDDVLAALSGRLAGLYASTGGHRSRTSSCCVRRCYRRSSRSARSGS